MKYAFHTLLILAPIAVCHYMYLFAEDLPFTPRDVEISVDKPFEHFYEMKDQIGKYVHFIVQ